MYSLDRIFSPNSWVGCADDVKLGCVRSKSGWVTFESLTTPPSFGRDLKTRVPVPLLEIGPLAGFRLNIKLLPAPFSYCFNTLFFLIRTIL